uniref:Uncharacterized protein n=1 Tax=Oryza punctata TaxID=4537 RepID=A0A0E0ME18_ORYPU
MSSDVPGYFVGRPMNYAEPAKEQQQGGDEQRPAANAQIPGAAHASPAAELRAKTNNSGGGRDRKFEGKIEANLLGVYAQICVCIAKLKSFADQSLELNMLIFYYSLNG